MYLRAIKFFLPSFHPLLPYTCTSHTWFWIPGPPTNTLKKSEWSQRTRLTYGNPNRHTVSTISLNFQVWIAQDQQLWYKEPITMGIPSLFAAVIVHFTKLVTNFSSVMLTTKRLLVHMVFSHPAARSFHLFGWSVFSNLYMETPPTS